MDPAFLELPPATVGHEGRVTAVAVHVTIRLAEGHERHLAPRHRPWERHSEIQQILWSRRDAYSTPLLDLLPLHVLEIREEDRPGYDVLSLPGVRELLVNLVDLVLRHPRDRLSVHPPYFICNRFVAVYFPPERSGGGVECSPEPRGGVHLSSFSPRFDAYGMHT